MHAHRWLPLLSAATTNAAAGTLFAWSVLLPSLSRELARPADDLGSVFSTALVVFALAVLLGGRAVDLYGPRRAVTVAGLLSGLGLAVSAAAAGPLLLHVGFGVLLGAGSGLAYLGSVSWATTRARTRRAHAIAVVVASYAAGPVAAAPFGAAAADRWGWRPTLVAAAVVVCVLMLAGGRGLPGRGEGPPGTAVARSRAPLGDRVALAMLWVVFFGAAAPALLAFAYGAQVATEHGVSPRAAGVVVASMAAGNVVGRLLSSPLTARSGPVPALWSSAAVLLASLLVLASTAVTAVAVLGLFLLSLQYGLVSALLPAATHDVSGEGRFGAAYGRVFSSFGVAAVAGPAVGAALHERADAYAGGFGAALATAAATGLALAVYQRRLRLGRRAAGRCHRH